MIITTALTAGQAQEYTETADFFRLLDSTVSTTDVTVIFYRAGVEVSRAEGVGEGYAEKFNAGTFDRIRIQARPPTGQVTVSGSVTVGNFPADRGAFTQTQRTVTNASAQMLAANASRRYLLIQNKDTAGIVYVNLQGSTATVANGLAIEPGGSLELQGYVPSGAITAIGSIASNANVISVEG